MNWTLYRFDPATKATTYKALHESGDWSIVKAAEAVEYELCYRLSYLHALISMGHYPTRAAAQSAAEELI